MNVAGFKASSADGVGKFSLAGGQLKSTGNANGKRMMLTGRGDTGQCIIKVASEPNRGLPEAE